MNLDTGTGTYRLGTRTLLKHHDLSEIGMHKTSVADPWHFGVDPDPDPSIFIIDLQDANKKRI